MIKHSVCRRLRRAEKENTRKNKILEDRFRPKLYDVYVQFFEKIMCMCSFVYVRFWKVDIHTGRGWSSLLKRRKFVVCDDNSSKYRARNIVSQKASTLCDNNIVSLQIELEEFYGCLSCTPQPTSLPASVFYGFVLMWKFSRKIVDTICCI